MKKIFHSKMIESTKDGIYVILPSDTLEKQIKIKWKLEKRNSKKRKSVLLQKKNDTRVTKNIRKLYNNRSFTDELPLNDKRIIINQYAINNILQNINKKGTRKINYKLTEHDGEGKLPPIDE